MKKIALFVLCAGLAGVSQAAITSLPDHQVAGFGTGDWDGYDYAAWTGSETEGKVYVVIEQTITNTNGLDNFRWHGVELEGSGNTDQTFGKRFDSNQWGWDIGSGVYGNFQAVNLGTNDSETALYVIKADLDTGDMTVWFNPDLYVPEQEQTGLSASRTDFITTLDAINYRTGKTSNTYDWENGALYTGGDTPFPLTPFVFESTSPSGTGTTNPVVLSVVVADGTSEFDSAQLWFDGTLVTPDSVDTVSGITTVSYAAGSLDPLTTHTGKVVVAGINPVTTATNEWTFTMMNALDFVSGSPSGGGSSSETPTLEVVISDALSELDDSGVELYLDGSSVTVDYTNADDPSVGQTTVGGDWEGSALAAGSTHTGMVVYAGINPAAGPFTNTWTFSVAGDPGYGIYIGDTNAPTPGADDIYQFAYSSADAGNVGDGDDASSYIAHEAARGAQGQSFTTGSGSSQYTLSSVWVKHVTYPTYSNFEAGDDHVLRITDPALANTAGFVVHSEELVVITNTAVAMYQGTGTGNWIEYRLQSPVTLSASKEYAFDIGAGPEGNEYYDLAGINSNVYAGGSAYTSGGSGAGDNNITARTGDRTFMVSLTTGGPSVTPNIQAIVVSGGSATLTWDSETGVTYKILNKTNLTSAGWSEAKTGISGTGTSTSDSVAMSGSDQEFFRIEGQ